MLALDPRDWFDLDVVDTAGSDGSVTITLGPDICERPDLES